MSAPSAKGSFDFKLTQRQRRLRTATIFIVLTVIALIAVGLTHPFFHPDLPNGATRAMRSAYKVQLFMITTYWTACFLLGMSLVVIAWLELREIQNKLVAARKEIWKDVEESYLNRLPPKNEPS